MPKVHVVKQGDCLSSIAHEYGFSSYRAIYDHPDNQEFRRRRSDPAVLLPGDRLVIPERELKTVPLQTGSTYRFQLRAPMTALRLYLRDRGGNAIAGKEYVLQVGVQELRGSTSSEGLVDERIPASAKEALLSVPSINLLMRLRLGALDPVETVNGVQARLNNLGFEAGAVESMLGPKTRRALSLFQEANGLERTGELDDNTRAALVRAHGS